jgi:endoglucanase
VALTSATERSGIGRKLVIGGLIVLAAAFGLRSLISGVVNEPRVYRDELAEEFLDRYVESDGRVVRRDQGSDTVSEGQAYAMLLAVARDDAARFGLVWEWTKRELQRPDGLLSWHWSEGGATDSQPASDADVDAAYALLLAGERFGNPGYVKDARRIAAAVMDAETIGVEDGRVLVAGLWARDERVVNPSYIFPEAYRRFGAAFGDDRWDQLVRGSVATVERLASADSLPPDWATIASDGSVSAGRPSGGGAESSTGYDAARIPIRFASSCEKGDRDIAARLWPAVRNWGNSAQHASQIVAAAAAAHAAGERTRSEELLDRAEAAVRDQPSYYGWALVALGPALLDPETLRDCPGPIG